MPNLSKCHKTTKYFQQILLIRDILAVLYHKFNCKLQTFMWQPLICALISYVSYSYIQYMRSY